MKFKRHVSLEKGQLDIAPLIDVVFLLLIFFMLTSSFVFQPGVKVNLPKAMTSEVLHQKSLIVTITGENTLYVENSPVTMEEFKKSLKVAALENKSLLIKADKFASVGKVVEIWDLCRQEGVTQVNIATLQELK